MIFVVESRYNLCNHKYVLDWIDKGTRVAPSGAYGLVWLTCAINMSILAEFRTQIFIDFSQNWCVWDHVLPIQFTLEYELTSSSASELAL